MKTIFTILVSLVMTLAFAHEGGHGELEEGGKFGGVTAPIVDSSEAGKGNKAKFFYKAELVRGESGKLSLYVFDQKMKLIDLAVLGNEVDAKLEVKKKGKFTYVGDFKLTKHGNHFMGQLPKIDYKPFNIDFFLVKGDQKLFVGFSNLD
jgi:hypothetical protein